VIATDISRDGAMQGTNRELYARLAKYSDINIIASGGVSSLDDIRALRQTGVYGAILGKAMYTGAVTVEDGIAAAEGRL
jgi:phosphoribosylformimino-5-aminoimidazole carboxamide ribotide isomerase